MADEIWAINAFHLILFDKLRQLVILSAAIIDAAQPLKKVEHKYEKITLLIRYERNLSLAK